MPNNTIGRKDATDPIYGIQPATFTPGDFGSRDSSPLTALNAVSANTTSTAQTVNARDVELVVSFGTAGSKCDILVYRVDAGPTDTLVLTKLNVFAGSVFVGGFESVNLDGKQIKVRAQNISAGTVTVKIKRK